VRQDRRGGQFGEQRVGVVAPAAQRAGAGLCGESFAQRGVARQLLEACFDGGGIGGGHEEAAAAFGDLRDRAVV